MRVIKLSTKELGDIEEFFTQTLPKRNGKLYLTKGRIAKNGIALKETIVFACKGKLLYFATASSELQENTDIKRDKYPNCFSVEVSSIVPATGNLTDLAVQLQKSELFSGTLQGRGWNKIEENKTNSNRFKSALEPFIYAWPADERRYIEGERKASQSTVRNPKLRKDAKKRWGVRCYCCGFDFGDFYGGDTQGCAIVHHLKMFNSQQREATVEDVRVVCANCHLVIHLIDPPMDVDQLGTIIRERWKPWTRNGVEAR
jgi:hypothetical protein